MRKATLRRALRLMAAGVAGPTAFLGATFAAVVLHLDLPATRRLVAAQTSSLASSALSGQIAIERIGTLDLDLDGVFEIAGVRGRVRDPEGVEVLFVDGASVRVRIFDLVGGLLAGDGPVPVHVENLGIDHVEANLDASPPATLRLARAFEPRNPGADEGPPGRGVRVVAPALRLSHAWVHGTPPSAPWIDAELDDLRARGASDPSRLSAEILHLGVVGRALPLGADPRGSVSGRVVAPSETGEQVYVYATYDGVVLGIPTVAETRIDGARIDARVDLHDKRGQGVRAVLGEGVDLEDDLVVHGDVHGVLPRLDVAVNASLGRATLAASGDLALEDTTGLSLTASARHVDLARILDDAPSSDLGLDARAEAKIDAERGPSGHFDVTTLRSRVGTASVPSLSVRGDLASDTLHAIGALRDPAMAADFAVVVAPRGGERMVETNLRAHVPRIDALPVSMPVPASGAITVHGSGILSSERKGIDAQVALETKDFALRDIVTAEDARVDASVTGTVDAPMIAFAAHAQTVRAGTFEAGSVDVRSHVRLGREIVLGEPHVDVARGSHAASAIAERVVVSGDRFRADRVVATGFGRPIHGDLRREGDRIIGSLDAPEVDLATLGYWLGRSSDLRRGTLALSGSFAIGRDELSADLRARAEHASFFSVDGADIDVHGRAEGREIDLDARADLADAGRLSVKTKATRIHAGAPLDARTWRRSPFDVDFDVDLDLSKLKSVIPEGTLPVGELGGRLQAGGSISRAVAPSGVDLDLHAKTRGLIVSSAQVHERAIDRTEVKSAPALRSDDVDLQLDVGLDGDSNLLTGAFRAVDEEGIVAALDLKAQVPIDEILAAPELALERAKTAPFALKVVVPERELARMPRVLRQSNVFGRVAADLDLAGSVVDPHLTLRAHGRGVRSGSESAVFATDTDVALAYDGRRAQLEGHVTNRGRRVMALGSTIELSARDVLAGRSPIDWNASGKIVFDGMPLDAVSSLGDQRVEGRVTGEVALEQLHRDASLKARLDLDGLSLGRAKYERGHVELDAGSGHVSARARLDQKDGFADLSANAGMRWGKDLAPSADLEKPVDLRLVAKAFRAAALAPFLPSGVDHFDGRIDADAAVRLAPHEEPRLQGKVTLAKGRVQLAALGDELRGVKATILMQPNGRIRIEDVEARSASGRLLAEADIVTHGVAIARANASVRIPEKSPFDVALDGQPIGEVWGEAHLNAKGSEERLDVTVDVPKLHVDVAETTKSGVQTLGEHERIRVGRYRNEHEFVILPTSRKDLEDGAPEDATKSAMPAVSVDIHLKEVVIVRGNMARVVLAGSPRVVLDEGEPEVTGRIDLRSGKVDLQGKQFEIERGIVTFAGSDPGNPTVVVTAKWEAADGTQVFADFVGPVKTGKVRLRSEPPRPENEILALVLFGSADGANPSPTPSRQGTDTTTKTALGLGGGYAAQGLTEALDDLAGIEAQARIDTTRANNPRPELEFQLSRTVSFEVSHVLGTPPLSQPDKNFATLEWHFFRNWSLESTFGDRGSSIFDAVWQKRY